MNAMDNLMKKKKVSRSNSKVPALDLPVVQVRQDSPKKFESPDNQSKTSALKGTDKNFKRSNSTKKVAFHDEVKQPKEDPKQKMTESFAWDSIQEPPAVNFEDDLSTPRDIIKSTT